MQKHTQGRSLYSLLLIVLMKQRQILIQSAIQGELAVYTCNCFNQQFLHWRFGAAAAVDAMKYSFNRQCRKEDNKGGRLSKGNPSPGWCHNAAVRRHPEHQIPSINHKKVKPCNFYLSDNTKSSRD